jgi:hypothetical protein
LSGTVRNAQAAQATAKPPAEKIVWVNKNLRVAFPGMPPPAPPLPAGKQITYAAMQKSRRAWDELRKNLESQLKNLEMAIAGAVHEHNQDQAAEDRFMPNDVSAGTKNLYAILDGLDQRLIETLDKAMTTQGPERPKLLQQARALVAEYQAFTGKDPLIAAIDDNGFMPTMIKRTIEHTLTTVSENL